MLTDELGKSEQALTMTRELQQRASAISLGEARWPTAFMLEAELLAKHLTSTTRHRQPMRVRQQIPDDTRRLCATRALNMHPPSSMIDSARIRSAPRVLELKPRRHGHPANAHAR